MPLRRLLPLLLLALGCLAFYLADGGRFFDFTLLRTHQARLIGWVEQETLLAPLAFIGCYVLAVAFSLPVASFITVVGGFLFGAALGTLWSLLGATLGAALVFLAARSAFADTLRNRAGPQLKKLETAFRADGIAYLLFLRLVPLFPFWLVNVAPAFFGMALAPYILATMIGILPGTFVFAYFGQGLGDLLEAGTPPSLESAATPGIMLALCLLAVLALLPIGWKRWRKRHGKGS
jgi:uncharacterized membrane protein YdjX (TVP38/TMEM64 family)